MIDISAASAPAIQLTRGARDNMDPSWGPSSKHLIFASNRAGAREIYMMNVDTKQAKQLTRGANALTPEWGPIMP